MNEMMIQEAVLDSVDQINEAQLFAEFDVLMAMADVYTKSAMIQESNSAISFDGYSIIQEATDDGEDDNKKSGKFAAVKTKFKNAGSAVLGWLKRVWVAITSAFSAIFAKIKSLLPKKISKDAVEDTVKHGGDVVLKVGVAERLGLPQHITQEVVKTPEFKEKAKTFDISDFEYYKVPIRFSPRALEPCVQHLQKSFEAYNEMINGGLDSASYNDRKRTCDREREAAYKLLSKGAQAFAGGKVAEKVDYKDIYETLQKLSPIVGDILKKTREIQQKLNSLKFGDSENGVSDQMLQDLKSSAGPMINIPKSLLNIMNEMREAINPTNVKKRAENKMKETEYEDAEDAFIPKGQ